jgi:hypothetical protein
MTEKTRKYGVLCQRMGSSFFDDATAWAKDKDGKVIVLDSLWEAVALEKKFNQNKKSRFIFYTAEEMVE